MMSKSYSVYWIKRKSYTNPFAEGYVGVSVHPERRFKEHHNNKFILGNALRKYDDIVLVLLHTGLSKNEACNIEYEYRPTKEIGWNLIEGGGIPPSNKGKKFPERSKLFEGVNNPFYGKTHSESIRKRLSEKKQGENHPFYGKKRPSHSKTLKAKVGEKYPRFRGWYVTPAGKFDSYKTAHEKTGLSVSSLYNYCIYKNDHIINNYSFGMNPFLQKLGREVIGKTYSEIGFGFIPRDSG